MTTCTKGPFGSLVDGDVRYSIWLEPERFTTEQRKEWNVTGPSVGETLGTYRERCGLKQAHPKHRDHAVWTGSRWIELETPEDVAERLYPRSASREDFRFADRVGAYTGIANDRAVIAAEIVDCLVPGDDTATAENIRVFLVALRGGL